MVLLCQIYAAVQDYAGGGPALRLFAGLVAAVLVVLLAADQDTLLSVWCFFAASGSLLMIPAILSAGSGFRKEPAKSAPGSRRLPANSR